MAHSYVVSLHRCVFSTAKRQPLLFPSIRPQLFSYLGGIARNQGITLLRANGVNDHIHMLIGLPFTLTISKAMQLMKGNSSKWLREEPNAFRTFQWQEGYGAFSYGQSQIETVYNYILNQEKHHEKRTFKEEYLELLKKFKIEYDEKHLFEWYSD